MITLLLSTKAFHIEGRDIDFVFFSEIVAMDRVKEYQSRVKRFISRQPLEWQLDDYPEWMLDRWTFYTDRECGTEIEKA